jgi:two-component system cell cycle sensor histidine kinase/response regulator CckA
MRGESRFSLGGSDGTSMAAADIHASAAFGRSWRTFALIAAALFAVAAVLAALASGAGWRLAIALPGAAATGAAAAWLIRRRESAPAEPDFEPVVRALSEPAAIVAADGRIATSNDAWRSLVGGARRLEPSPLGGLHGLLRQSLHEGSARQKATVAKEVRQIEAARVDSVRFILRLAPVAPAASAAPAVGDDAAPTTAAPAKLDAFAAASPFGAALIDGQDPFGGAILQANAAWPAIAGEAARPGTTLGEVLDEATREEAAARFAKGGAGPFEVTPKAKPGSAAHLYVSRLTGRCVAYLVDVTEQKSLQAQLSQSNKMQAIGQLAGGVAHDFNNLLSGILLNLSELETRHPLGDPSFDGLTRIRQDAVRAAGLVRQLLTFSRKVTVQRETLDVGEVIGNLSVMLRRLVPESFVIDVDYGRNLPQVRADPQQLETAVVNLVVNARDAMRERGHGKITIRTARLGEAEAVALGYGGAPAGEMALIEVADNGPGIPPDVLPKIFEPFFTTKAVGEGTGLGLATVYGIVKQSDGWIQPVSQFGEGAAFRIFLPVYEPQVLVAPQTEPKARSAARDLSGVGRILFVEDEDSVRKVAARLLRARGYEVIEAADGEEALVIAEENAGRIDLMISDVIMPGMEGPQLLKAARPYLGEAPVMFISGYAEAEFSKLLEGESGITFLPKPIDISVLAERVKQALQA